MTETKIYQQQNYNIMKDWLCHENTCDQRSVTASIEVEATIKNQKDVIKNKLSSEPCSLSCRLLS